MLNVTRSIDWVSFSFKMKPKDLWLWQDGGIWQQSRKPHYETSYLLANGIQIYRSESKVQGNLCVITGSAMNDLRFLGHSDFSILSRCWEQAKNFTRIDYAVDVTGDVVSMPVLARGLEEGKCPNLGRKKVRIIKGIQNDEGFTAYVGSRSSELMLRAYDKGVEHKVRGITWARLELEMKRNRARQFAHNVSSTGVITSGDDMLVSFADIRQCANWVKEALETATASKLEPIERKKSNYGAWLQQVLNSIKKRSSDPNFHSDIAYFRTRINEIELE